MAVDHDSTEAAADGKRPGTGRIVVGVDGSYGSRAALEWAIREAQVRVTSVHIVVVWQYPHTISDSAWGLGMGPSLDVQEAVAAASAEVAHQLGLKASAQGDASTTWEAIEGNPARALIAASDYADLLVVGSRGHGAFVGALLGSVSHQVVAHARCPVVVVPAPPTVEDRTDAETEIPSARW